MAAARGDAGPDSDFDPLYVRVPGNDLGPAEAVGDPYARLAVEHGLAVHQASLAWAGAAITQLAADRELASPGTR